MPEPSLVAAIARRELATEHPAVMLERLLREKHNLILENEKLREALKKIADGASDCGTRNAANKVLGNLKE